MTTTQLPPTPTTQPPASASAAATATATALSTTRAGTTRAGVGRASAGPRFDAGPLFGEPAGFRFDGVERWLWWGQNLDGEDCVATRGGRLLTFESAAQCEATFPVLTLKALGSEASAQGPCGSTDSACGSGSCGCGSDEETTDESGPVTADLGPAQNWVRGKRLAVPAESVLNLWNLGIDVAHSTGQRFPQRTRQHDLCFDKLMAQYSPHMFGLDEYRPVWSSRELTMLRETLARAIHVLRTALP